ncbi:MAG: hypothetical protein IJY79_02760, partial [Clostridia bacterium]|nr:hypothetical protein [Clostridia bacterium]
MYSFGELFDKYLSAETLEIFSSAEIGECKLNSENRSLNLRLCSDIYIPHAKVNTFREEIKHALRLENAAVEIAFASNAFCTEAIEDIVAEIRAKNIIFNGFFNKAQYAHEDSDLKITLKY